MIVDYSVGHTGSVHDSWAFRSTRTCKEHERIFGLGEWMWADSAYPSETWSVSPFKKPARRELSPDQKTFNYHLSKIRIRVEHAIGLLKGRFQSLFELRIQIYTHEKHLWAVMWIRCCIILHNLVLQIEAGKDDREWREELYNLWDRREGAEHRRWQEEAETESEDDLDELELARRRLMTAGQKFRCGLMKKLFDSETSEAVRRV
jgi:hypothetical protein